MLNNVIKLFVAEVKRLKKYNILQISVFLTLIYAVIIYFTSAQEAEMLVSLLVFVDVTMMSIILLGASLFFEKQEGSLKSVMVSPVKLVHVIIAKTASTVLLSMITASILSAVAIFVHGATINVPLLILYAILGSSVHICIGFLLTIKSKDFNSLLINYVIYVLIFTMPAIFYAVGIIPENLYYIILISPSYIAQMLINTSIGQLPKITELVFGIAYSIALIVLIYKFYILKKFKEYVIRG